MPTQFVYRIGGTGTGISQTEQDQNIHAIYDTLTAYGFTLEAVCGAIGCFHEESGLNPGIYETSHGGNLNNLPYFPGGMGLAQWTDYPAYQGTYPNPLAWSAQQEGQNWYDGAFQCWLCNQADNANYTSMGYGQGPRWGWQQSSQYYPNDSIAFSSYKAYTGDVAKATRYWFFCFEWHYTEQSAISALGPTVITDRQAWANYAYQLLQGYTPDPPTPGPGPGPGPSPTGTRKMPIWMMLKHPWLF